MGGTYFSTSPNLLKVSEDESSENLSYGASGMQGWRTGMEDAHLACLDIGDNYACFGVFDGHGGKEVAQFVGLNFVEHLKENQNLNENPEKALEENFFKMDELLETKEGKKELLRLQRDLSTGSTITESDDYDLRTCAGCTAVVALIRENKLYVANAGDCRCILIRGGRAFEMSEDHKPDLPKEKERIQRARGGFYDGRVNGDLHVSRSIGDLGYKGQKDTPRQLQEITALPDVRSADLGTEDSFIVLACDGVWDMLTNEQVANFVTQRKREDSSIALSKICEEILDQCLAPDVQTSGGLGCDNMTCIIIELIKQ